MSFFIVKKGERCGTWSGIDRRSGLRKFEGSSREKFSRRLVHPDAAMRRHASGSKPVPDIVHPNQGFVESGIDSRFLTVELPWSVKIPTSSSLPCFIPLIF
jgi:hypothetical protein